MKEKQNGCIQSAEFLSEVADLINDIVVNSIRQYLSLIRVLGGGWWLLVELIVVEAV